MGIDPYQLGDGFDRYRGVHGMVISTCVSAFAGGWLLFMMEALFHGGGSVHIRHIQTLITSVSINIAVYQVVIVLI